jgi:ubiquinone/menaquinone biosynthesis C-methylase UbiE
MAVWDGPEPPVVQHQLPTFFSSGDLDRQLLIELAGLRPDDAMLDVGSGPGRIAIALADFLTEGSYEGFDINERVQWCQEHITPRQPNFRFRAVDIYNGTYNAKGETKATDLRFPYEDRSFDVVCLFSVFTHMLGTDVEHYISEIARVLKPGGRCLATFLLLNSESLALIEQDEKRSDPAPNALQALFSHNFGSYRISNPASPERVVAFDEAFVFDTYERSGLHVQKPIHYGLWPGRSAGRSQQDVVVVER